jgi:hypothetical protein
MESTADLYLKVHAGPSLAWYAKVTSALPSSNGGYPAARGAGVGRWTKPLYKDFPRCQAGVLCFSFATQAVGLAGSCRGRVALKVRCDREQTAHLQTVLLHLPVRTQIRTAQPGSIRATWLGTIAAAYGLSSSPAAGLTCQMHLREHVLGGGNGLGCGVDRWSWFVAVLRPSR